MAILVSGWSISKTYSIQKSHGQMNQDLAVSIYGMSSIKLANFISIGQNTCSTWEIPVSVWLKFKHSETRRQNECSLCKNDEWDILYKMTIFRADRTTNMATIGYLFL